MSKTVFTKGNVEVKFDARQPEFCFYQGNTLVFTSNAETLEAAFLQMGEEAPSLVEELDISVDDLK
jgi:hypothetical protein